MIRRRDFLRSGLASALGSGLFSGLSFPGLAQVLVPGSTWRRREKTLVLLELTGGNDGLNTFVPWADDRYHRARPALRIDAGMVLKAGDVMGFAPELEGLAALHRDGCLAVIQNVGMPTPDRSHFTSLDRWHTGDVSDSLRAEGWLGRSLAAVAPAEVALPGLALGDRTLPRVFRGTDRPVAACDRLEELVPSPAARAALLSKELWALDSAWGGPGERALAEAARELCAGIERVLKEDTAGAGIIQSPLGRQLEDVLRILKSRLRVPAVFVRTGGFDTHARQDAVQPALLRNLDAALAPFIRALVKAGLAEDVLVVVYSEFGRRVAENGSRGTDHGAANPVFLLGGGLPAGVHGPPPDLGDLVEGDVRPSCDFRAVLAQALKHLGHPDPAGIIGPAGRPIF